MRWFVTVVIAALFTATCSTRVVHERPASVASAAAININTATPDELEGLPGVGRKTADAIVAYRTANGPFRRVEHLMMIRGISERRFAEFRPLVRVE